MSDVELAVLSAGLEVVFAPSRTSSMAVFMEDKLSLGPIFVECGTLERPAAVRRAFGPWPPGGPRAAVPLRSVSKTFVAIAVLALVERREELGHSLSLQTRADIMKATSLNA
ncbi:hypothetical protein T492DRAFT_869838 [Pavlovales sp. CCMP2436]|nr:hypothetical protein T492DRAFT_869838 [Pavlovales sp. CCMP2436]